MKAGSKTDHRGLGYTIFRNIGFLNILAYVSPHTFYRIPFNISGITNKLDYQFYNMMF